MLNYIQGQIGKVKLVKSNLLRKYCTAFQVFILTSEKIVARTEGEQF